MKFNTKSFWLLFLLANSVAFFHGTALADVTNVVDISQLSQILNPSIPANTNQVVAISTNNAAASKLGSMLGVAVGTPAAVVANYLAPNTKLLSASRWTFFGCYTKASGLPAASKSNVGYSLGAVYYVNSVVGTQVRCQYLDTGRGGGANAVLLPNGEITLSSAYAPFGSNVPISIRPILEMGAAADLRGQMHSIAGAGSELDLYTTTNSVSALQRVSVFYGKEQWQGSNDKFVTTQIGGAINFNLEALQKSVVVFLQSHGL